MAHQTPSRTTNLQENGGHFSWSTIPPLHYDLLRIFSFAEYTAAPQKLLMNGMQALISSS